MNDVISMNHIVKVFPPNVVALDNVSVTFREREIHAVVGENGAGKSTLMKILYGMQHANSGEILYRGKSVKFNTPGEAISGGIGMVHQEIMLIPEYTVWENVILGVEPTGRFGKIDQKRTRNQVKQRIDAFQFNLDPDAKVEDISVAARQKVEILKLLYRNVSFLILDEPTSVLTPQEIPQLFDELRRLRDDGRTIVFISHHLEEVLDLSDRITVLRKGQKVDTIDTNSATRTSLAQMMVGREVVFESLKKPLKAGEPVFNMSGIDYIDPLKRPRLQAINIQVRAGEITGIAGVEGNGQLELVKVIMGLLKPDRGKVVVQGEDLTASSILERRKKISFVSQDRANMGSCLTASIKENVIMTHHRLNKRFTKWGGGVLNDSQINAFTDEIRGDFDIQMDNRESEIKSLSGGNQQKVILGRELSLDTPFLLLDQPTRGLDVGSVEYIHQHILKMRDENHAVLLLSADLEELFRISDRILVLHRGRIVANLVTDQTSISEVGYLMLEGGIHETETHR
ncbi:MAG: ABC transporter ATP-binding protein [Flexilinea sp.]